MAGNVWEWVNDWFSNTYYQDSPSSGPLGPEQPDLSMGVELKVTRGGSWNNDPRFVRSTFRSFTVPAYANDAIGFRCARDSSP